VVQPARTTRITNYVNPPYYAPFFVQRQRIDNFFPNGQAQANTRQSFYPPNEKSNS
jgi:hypothetical protein